MTSLNGRALLEAEGVVKHYPTGRRFGKGAMVRAVDGVDLHVEHGETVGLVGESGCGKSTLGRTLIRLDEPTSGSIKFEGIDLALLDNRELKRVRRRMQMVFQDPAGSLNPRMRVRDIVAEGLDIHDVANGAERRRLVSEMLEQVGLTGKSGDKYPHEFSGGQRQRIGIARALILEPSLVIADEPVSSLDVSVQSQVLNLLVSLKESLSLTMIFIAHDIGVVGYLADRIAVMYLGKIVEFGDAKTVLSAPKHPYTIALLSAVPSVIPGNNRSRIVLQGDVPSPLHPPSGCRFRTRCPIAQEVCATNEPQLMDAGDGRMTACHFSDDLATLFESVQ